MVVAVKTFDIHIPGCRSLKEKRFVIRSLKDRIRTKFNVAVAEVENQDLWQRATIAVASVNEHKGYLDGLLQKVSEVVASERRIVILSEEVEFW